MQSHQYKTSFLSKATSNENNHKVVVYWGDNADYNNMIMEGETLGLLYAQR